MFHRSFVLLNLPPHFDSHQCALYFLLLLFYCILFPLFFIFFYLSHVMGSSASWGQLKHIQPSKPNQSNKPASQPSSQPSSQSVCNIQIFIHTYLPWSVCNEQYKTELNTTRVLLNNIQHKHYNWLKIGVEWMGWDWWWWWYGRVLLCMVFIGHGMVVGDS